MNPSCIITEYIEHGNLFEYLHSEKTGEIPWILRLKIALDIAKVLGFPQQFRFILKYPSGLRVSSFSKSTSHSPRSEITECIGTYSASSNDIIFAPG